MKNILINYFARISFYFLILLQTVPSAAQNISTESLLIEKLTGVFLKLPDGDETKNKITLRLADLHAERGRLIAKEESEKGCLECTLGAQDRKKALEYYQYVLANLKGEQKQNVLVQMGHIYEVTGENAKAIEFYKRVLGESSNQGMAEAQFSLAEIYFKQRNYSESIKYYNQALEQNNFSRKGMAYYRLAWCHYNLGQIEKSIQTMEKILSTPKLLTRSGDNLVNVDQDFKLEVAKDYTVFMAHSTAINEASIKQVYNLSPEASRMENVTFLAKELERLGRLTLATKAWELVVNETSDPQTRMEGLVYLASLQLKENQKDKVLPYLKKAFSHWSSMSSCQDQKQCEELKNRVRLLVFEWNRGEKQNPSTSLIEAYQAYFTVAPQDAEALELASQAAIQAKNYELANQWNKAAYPLAKDSEKKETLLLRRIEIAELSKNKQYIVEAQNAYLKESPTGSKSAEILYQMTQSQYDSKNYEQAAQDFKKITSQKNASEKLKLQSAEMALDSLVLAKNDSLIEEWATDFSKQFPKQSQRFLSLAGQSILSQTASLSASDKGSDLKVWETLSRFDYASADNEKKKIFLKNKIILSRKLKKLDELKESLHKYLSLNNLTNDEKTFALENKVWLSELQLNFVAAFETYKELNTKDWLELARLADLAERPSKDYYLNYLKGASDEKLAYSICLNLVKKAMALNSDVKTCIPILQTDKVTFANLILEIYGSSKTSQDILNTFRTYGLTGTPASLVLTRSQLLQEGEQRISSLNKHKLDGRTQNVGQSLKQRLNLLTQFEKTIAHASQTQDWLTQTLFLTDLHKQYIRFYEELLSLPMPTELTQAEQQEYLTLLSQQAAPYKEKAQEIQSKLDELWKNDKAIDQIYADFHKSSMGIQALLGPQIEKLKQVIDEKDKGRFELVYRKEQKKSLPTLSLLEKARQEVKSSPLNKDALKKLIVLETERGYQPMIIYLNSRLKMVDQGFESNGRAL
jgi:hypothetical protein